MFNRVQNKKGRNYITCNLAFYSQAPHSDLPSVKMQLGYVTNFYCFIALVFTDSVSAQMSVLWS